jgi:hypothetical protein
MKLPHRIRTRALIAVTAFAFSIPLAAAAAAPLPIAKAETVSHSVTPDASKYVNIQTYNDGNSLLFLCSRGKNYNTGEIANDGGAYQYISSCSTRVWLHEYTYPKYKKAGWAYCLGPGQGGVIPSQYKDAFNVQISFNSNGCGGTI